jgi:hypothetical protein
MKITLLLSLLLVSACAAPKADRIDPRLDLETGIARAAVVTLRSQVPAERQVILIRDRHSTNPGFHRVRPQLAEIQGDHRRLVGFLSARGWGLLGCEYKEGPLVENDETRSQYRIIRRRMETDGRDSPFLDGWSIFQPIRYQLLFGDRLEVRGVEDAELYALDLEYFSEYKRAAAFARRRDIDEGQRREALALATQAQRALEANTDARGRAAARNLLNAMDAGERQRAILMLGGAHVPAAIEELAGAGVGYRVLESRSYRAARDPKAYRRPADDAP